MQPPQENSSPHRLMLEERKHLTVSGMVEVESFDDTSICLSTPHGRMLLRGQSLQLLSADGSGVEVTGRFEAVLYEPERPAGSWLHRLLG